MISSWISRKWVGPFFLLALLFVLLVSGCATSGNGDSVGQGQVSTPAIGGTNISVQRQNCNGALSCVTPTSVATATPVPGTVPGAFPGFHFIDTSNNIHLFGSFDYNMNDPGSLAKYYDFVWGVTPSNVSAFRTNHPNMTLSYYIPFNRDPGTFLDQGPDVANQHNLNYWRNLHPDWILYQCDRSTPALEDGDPNIPFDFSNPDVVKWQVQNFASVASENGYDAIAADNLNMENLVQACGHYDKNGNWVQRYSGAISDQQWRSDILTWVTNMQAALHALPHPLALIPNLGIGAVPINDPILTQVVNHVDGILDESGFTNYGQGYVSQDYWTQYVPFIKKVQSQGKPYYIVNEFDGNWDTPISTNQIQWALSSYLMAKDNLAMIFISHSQQYGIDRRFNEYTAPIGTAKGDMSLAQNVYMRNYSGGLVVVNPSDSNTFTVNLNGSYVDLYGNHPGQSITLPPHSGVVLLNG